MAPPMASLVLVALAVLAPAPLTLACLGGNPATSIGTTLPSRAISLQPGGVFNITCLVNPRHALVVGYSADDLYFERETSLATGVTSSRVPADQITRLNDTAIMMTSSLETEARHTFKCFLNRRQLKTTGVCMTTVNVGRPPLPVEDFHCISHNWINVTCSWLEPFNAIRTSYQIKYSLKTFQHYERRCHLLPATRRPRRPGSSVRRSCVVRHMEFRPTHEYFMMHMNASNALGTVDFDPATFETYAIVLPAPPDALTVTNTSARALRVNVTVGHPMYAFPKPLDFSVSYVSPWDPSPVEVPMSAMTSLMSSREKSRFVDIQDLKPFTNYTISARIKSSQASGAGMWSRPRSATFTTLPDIPAAAPTTTLGSFQLVGQRASRSVYIYWRQIAPSARNGRLFHYCVSAWTPDGAPIAAMTPSQLTAAYAKFSSVSMQSVEFRIKSCNAEGETTDEARVVIPARADEVARPHDVTKLVEASNQYRIKWKEAAQHPADSYTVFWCQHQRDRPFQCEGELGWELVPGDRREHRLRLAPGSEYQLAVAANRANISSGMVWSHCTLLDNGESVSESIHLYVKGRGSRRLVLSWYSECSGRRTLPQYVFYYCRLDQHKCQGTETRLEAGATVAQQQMFVVSGLMPYTDYRLSVALNSEKGESQRIAVIEEKTDAAQPLPPARPAVTALSNTSLSVHWGPPMLANGVLDHYLLYVGEQIVLPVAGNVTQSVVKGLTAYTEYPIHVRACNSAWKRVGCSQQSTEALGRTLEGVPSAMEPPRTQLLNVSAARVRWRPPSQPAGPTPVYQLRVTSERDGQNVTSLRPLPAGADSVDLAIPECEPGTSQRHLFWIRATTVLPSGQRLMGGWSEPTQQNCVLASDWSTATIIGIVVAGAFVMMVVVLAFFLLCSRTKRKLSEMRNLGVNLPAGLERLEKPPLSAFAAAERRPGEGHSYGRLVSQNSAATDRTNTSVSGQPLLQDDSGREDLEGDSSDLTPPVHTDSNSCSSSTTNYNDSGAECDKGPPSPSFNKFSWPTVAEPSSSITPYVQVGAAETAAAPAAPPYSKFSPYVDAKGIQALMARSLGNIVSDSSDPPASRSVPDLAEDGEQPQEPAMVAPYSRHRSSTGYVSMASDDGVPLPRVAAPQPAPATSPATSPPPESKLPESAAVPTAAAAAAAAPAAMQSKTEAKTPELQPYVTLGPPPAAYSAGFPPYVLAGPPLSGAEVPPPVGACSPAHGTPPAATSSPLTWAQPRQQPPRSAPAAGKRADRSVGEPAPPPARDICSAGYVGHDKLRPAGIELTELAASTASSGYVSQEALRDATSAAAAAAAGEPVLSPKKLPTVATSRDPYCRVVTTHQGPPDLGPNVSMV